MVRIIKVSYDFLCLIATWLTLPFTQFVQVERISLLYIIFVSTYQFHVQTMDLEFPKGNSKSEEC
jgi:hypothetical protein